MVDALHDTTEPDTNLRSPDELVAIQTSGYISDQPTLRLVANKRAFMASMIAILAVLLGLNVL